MRIIAPWCGGFVGCGCYPNPINNNRAMTDRHNGGSNFSFADGHGKWLRVVVPDATNGWAHGDPGDSLWGPIPAGYPAAG